jgi:hypothetical protein
VARQANIPLSPQFSRNVFQYTAVVENGDCVVQLQYVTFFVDAAATASMRNATCTVRPPYDFRKLVPTKQLNECSSVSAITVARWAFVLGAPCVQSNRFTSDGGHRAGSFVSGAGVRGIAAVAFRR